eukprot:gene18467-26043_t
MSNKKTLVLVDGSSYLYRAFHAMPDLRAVPGDPTSPATGAIRGMINMMQALRKEVVADYAVCVFDASGPTFRDALYTEYKATRSPMPDDLRSQIEPIHEVVDLLGWKVVAVPGVDGNVLARLTPFVTVLPERTWINSNTASAEVVASGVPGLSLERARALLAARDKGQWFINRGDFTQRLRMPDQDFTELRVGITSNWFRVASVLDTVRTKFVLTALLHDDKQSLPRVVWLREGV